VINILQPFWFSWNECLPNGTHSKYIKFEKKIAFFKISNLFNKKLIKFISGRKGMNFSKLKNSHLNHRLRKNSKFSFRVLLKFSPFLRND